MATPSPVDWGGLVVTEIQLAGAAGGEQGVGGAQLDHPSVRVESRDPPAPPAFDDEVEREPVLPDSGSGSPGRVHESPLDLGAGGRPAGVDHAGG